jgi:hypothetical protein
VAFGCWMFGGEFAKKYNLHWHAQFDQDNQIGPVDACKLILQLQAHKPVSNHVNLKISQRKQNVELTILLCFRCVQRDMRQLRIY